MASVKISALPAATAINLADTVPIVQGGTTKQATFNMLNIVSVKDGTDPTKIENFDVSGITTGTTRTTKFPNANTTLPVISQVVTISGPTTDRTITVPDANFTAARTDAANTFTGHQTIEGVTSTGATGTGKFVFDGSPTLVAPVIGAATGTTLGLTGAVTSTQNALGNATADSVVLANTTASTGSGASVQQWSPAVRLTAHGWHTNGTPQDNTYDLRSYLSTVSTGDPSSGGGNGAVFKLDSQFNGGGYTNLVSLDFGGNLSALGAITASGAIIGTSNVQVGSAGSTTKLQNDGAGAIRVLNTSNNALATVGFSRLVLTKTTNYPVSVNDSMNLLNNSGASGEVDFTLPSVANTTTGLTFSFYVDAAQTLKIVPQTTAVIQVAGSTSTNGTGGGFVSTSTVGNCITITALSTTKWVTTAVVGTWTIN